MTKQQKIRAITLLISTGRRAVRLIDKLNRAIEEIAKCEHDAAMDAIYFGPGDHSPRCYAQSLVVGSDGHWCNTCHCRSQAPDRERMAG